MPVHNTHFGKLFLTFTTFNSKYIMYMPIFVFKVVLESSIRVILSIRNVHKSTKLQWFHLSEFSCINHCHHQRRCCFGSVNCNLNVLICIDICKRTWIDWSAFRWLVVSNVWSNLPDAFLCDWRVQIVYRKLVYLVRSETKGKIGVNWSDFFWILND